MTAWPSARFGPRDSSTWLLRRSSCIAHVSTDADAGSGRPPISSGGGGLHAARTRSTSSSGSTTRARRRRRPDGLGSGLGVRSDRRLRCRRLACGRLGARRRGDRGLALEAVEVLARDDDVELLDLLAGTGFVPGDERSGITWMDAADRPDVAGLAEGFALVDRTERMTRPTPCGEETAKGSPRACGSARSTTRHSTSQSRPPRRGRGVRALLVRPGDEGRAGRADASRGRVPTARPGPRPAHHRSRSAGPAWGTPPQGRLRHRCGARALRRRRFPRDHDRPVVHPERPRKRRDYSGRTIRKPTNRASSSNATTSTTRCRRPSPVTTRSPASIENLVGRLA